MMVGRKWRCSARAENTGLGVFFFRIQLLAPEYLTAKTQEKGLRFPLLI